MTIINILLSIAIWNLLMSIVNKQQTNRLFCGIIGFSGKGNFDADKIIQLMIWNSFARGMDATGIFSPKNGLVKTADSAPAFLLKNKLLPDRMLMAHVRAATVGNKDLAKNAHPFQTGNITLLHNGTLKNHWPLMRKHDLKWVDHDVDSQVICSIINKEQNFDVLKQIDGAAAMLINNTDTPDVLYAFRNAERPLFKGTIAGNMYISSIKESLQLIGAKNIKEFKENMLYRIKDGIILSEIEINNKPYLEKIKVHQNAHEIYPLAAYLNTWLMLKQIITPYYKAEADELVLYENYLVEGYESKTNTFTINNGKGKLLEVSKYDFYYHNEVITVGKYVKTWLTLTTGSGAHKKDIANTGDIFLVISDSFDGQCKAKHLKTNEVYTIGKNHLCRLNAKEEERVADDIEDTQAEQTIEDKDQQTIDFNQVDGFPDYSQDSLNDQPDSETPVDNDIDEDNIIEVDQKQLIEDFSFIDAGLDDLYEELIQITTVDQRNAYMSIHTLLQEKINDCKEQYEVEFETN